MAQPAPPRPSWLHSLTDETAGLPRKLAEGITTRIFTGAHVMLSVVRIAPHSTGTIHSHPEEQWGVLLEGRCVRIQGGEEADVRAGAFWQTPGGVPHGIRTGDEGALVLDIFSPPRGAYMRGGEGFGAHGPAGG